MVSEQHQRDATRYYSLHHQGFVFRDIAFGLRFYEFNDLISGHDFLVNSMLDIKCLGNLQYTIFLKPPAINPCIEKYEGNVRPVSTSTTLDLRAVPFSEKDDLFDIGELLLKLFSGEGVLKVLKKRGWHLRVICPSAEVGGKRVIWLPKDPDVSTVNFLIDHPGINCTELWASIIPLDERLSELLP